MVLLNEQELFHDWFQLEFRDTVHFDEEFFKQLHSFSYMFFIVFFHFALAWKKRDCHCRMQSQEVISQPFKITVSSLYPDELFIRMPPNFNLKEIVTLAEDSPLFLEISIDSDQTLRFEVLGYWQFLTCNNPHKCLVFEIRGKRYLSQWPYYGRPLSLDYFFIVLQHFEFFDCHLQGVCLPEIEVDASHGIHLNQKFLE